MFKPVSEKNTKKINEILKGGRNFYNIIAIIIIFLGIIISFKIDFFIKDCTLPIRYVQICFILFIISSAISYFVTSRKIILEAKQNLYKVHIAVYGTMIASGIIEIILLKCHLKLLSIMILLVIIAIIQNVIIIIISNRDYPELTYKNVKPDNTFRKQSKNLFAQKIAGIVFNNVDIILISKFIGSASVVIYTSYMYIVNSLQNVISKIGSSSLASVGNLLVEDSKKSKKIFDEYNALCFYIANIICVPLLLVITPFVKIFFGSSYTLPFIGSLFVVIIFYCKIIEIPLNVYNSALGYFDKTKKCAIFQSILNLTLSIILLSKYGILGILFATIISYVLGSFLFYPKILNKNYFKSNKIKYYSNSIKLSLIGILSFAILYLLTKNINVTNLLEWFALGIICFIINFILVTIYYKLIKQTSFFQRIKKLIEEKRNKNEKK